MNVISLLVNYMGEPSPNEHMLRTILLGNRSAALPDTDDAQELVRIEQREVPRDWRGKWVSKGGMLYQGRMIALKGDPIWTAISRFGQPYPPFDFNSGMGVDDVSYDEAVELGVIRADYQPPEKSPLKAFNEGLEAEMKVGNGTLLGKLREAFGDQIRNDNGVIRWRQDLIREAFNSNKPFAIRLGEATPDLLSKLPRSVPAQSCSGKSLTVDHTWLDRKRKDGSNHRDHFYPLEYRDTNIPLTIEDLELLPSIWREPDSVSDKTSNKWNIMCIRKALDGGVYKLVVNIKNNPSVVTFYKTKKP
ncbi:MAG: hypothetical protein ACI4R9_02140 [Kiritimatiellia bacterium]